MTGFRTVLVLAVVSVAAAQISVQNIRRRPYYNPTIVESPNGGPGQPFPYSLTTGPRNQRPAAAAPSDQITLPDQIEDDEQEGFDGAGKIGVRNNFIKRPQIPKAEGRPTHILPPSPSDLFGNVDFNKNLQEYKISRDVTEAINHFSGKLIQVVGTASVGNYVVSSFSLASVMAMLLAGSGGETYQEIKQAFAFPENPNATYTGFQVLLSELKRGQSTLVSSNRVFIREGFSLLPEFQWILKEKFGSPAQQIQFEGANAHQKINKVVAEDTKQKIQNLVEPGVFDNNTRLVALNTLYFKGQWVNQFLERATRPKEFHTLSGHVVQKDMMSTEDYFRVANLDFLNAKAIAMAYTGPTKMEMILIVPNEKTGVREVESTLATMDGVYEQIVNKLKGKPKNIMLTLPKFDIENKHDFENTLRVFGIHSAFSKFSADFSKIAGKDHDLYLSNVIQKAFLSVSESGSEAGAATFGALFTPLSIGPVVEDNIVIDRPFLGFVRDSSTNLVLFQFRHGE